MKKLILIILFLTIYPGSSYAEKCNSYENSVFQLADEVKIFQKSKKFKTYGWSSKFPIANNWLKKFKQLNSGHDDEAFNFSAKYDFNIGDLYSVADEYRTSGKLDSFYQDVEKDIKYAKRCEY